MQHLINIIIITLSISSAFGYPIRSGTKNICFSDEDFKQCKGEFLLKLIRDQKTNLCKNAKGQILKEPDIEALLRFINDLNTFKKAKFIVDFYTTPLFIYKISNNKSRDRTITRHTLLVTTKHFKKYVNLLGKEALVYLSYLARQVVEPKIRVDPFLEKSKDTADLINSNNCNMQEYIRKPLNLMMNFKRLILL